MRDWIFSLRLKVIVLTTSRHTVRQSSFYANSYGTFMWTRGFSLTCQWTNPTGLHVDAAGRIRMRNPRQHLVSGLKLSAETTIQLLHTSHHLKTSRTSISPPTRVGLAWMLNSGGTTGRSRCIQAHSRSSGAWT